MRLTGKGPRLSRVRRLPALWPVGVCVSYARLRLRLSTRHTHALGLGGQLGRLQLVRPGVSARCLAVVFRKIKKLVEDKRRKRTHPC